MAALGSDSGFFADLEDLIDSSQAFLRRKSNGSDFSLGVSGIMSDMGTGQIVASPQASATSNGTGSGYRRIRLRQMLDESFIHTPELESLAQQLESSPKLSCPQRVEKHSSFLRKANAVLESTGEFLRLEKECAEAFEKTLRDTFESIFEPPQTSFRGSRQSSAESSFGRQHHVSPGAVSAPHVSDEPSFALTPRHYYNTPFSRRRPDVSPSPHPGHTPPSASSRGFNPVSSPATGSSYSASTMPRTNPHYMRQHLHFSP